MQLTQARKDKFVKQTRFFEPGNKNGGNCAEAAVASILGITLIDVPDFRINGADAEAYWSTFKRFIRSYGYYPYMVPTNKGSQLTLPVMYLASGPSSRGCKHMVVMQVGNLLHDPHPSNEGILSIDVIHILIPFDPKLPFID